MKSLLTTIFLTSMALSLSAFATVEVTRDAQKNVVYKINCHNVEYKFGKINYRLPKDKQFQVNCTASTKKKHSIVTLTNSMDLCPTTMDLAMQYKSEITGSTAYYGISYKEHQQILDILFDHGVKATSKQGGTMTGYGVRNLTFPYCNR